MGSFPTTATLHEIKEAILTNRRHHRQAQIHQREQIVLGWIAAKREGARNGESAYEATTDFLIDVCWEEHGLKLSAKTLFNWKRAYQMHGREGLSDSRLGGIR